jgi:acyl-CoA reductase-like NAD-dependent aldehyde dehydrogenase
LETFFQEVFSTLEMARYMERMFPSWLKPRAMRYTLPGFFWKSNLCYWEPVGLVGLIAPGNFPFSLGMMTLIYLLLAGNTVAFKTSELSNKVVPLIAELLEVAGIPPEVVGIFSGGPETGKWLINEPSVKKIFFFGRRRNGEQVASMCKKAGKEYVLEMGGGTAAIICEDADIEIAARGVVWSACYANGEACISTKRVVVEKKVADQFLQKMKVYLEDIRDPGLGKGYVGPLGDFNWKEAHHIRELTEDALAQGAKLISGVPDPASAETNKLRPILLTGVTPSMRVWSEEIIGPFISVMVVEKAESALESLMGDLRPLGLSIWSRNLKRAQSIGFALPVTVAWINDISFSLPCLPWGGRGPTGLGTIFSKFSIPEVANIRWISVHPGFDNKPRVWWYPYTELKRKIFQFVVGWRY